MSSLTAHVLEAGDHGRLGFHPSCPVCRHERLFGSLSSKPLISRRVQAALATGVLALSTAAPGVAAAQERDRHREGVAAPEQPRAHPIEQPAEGTPDDPNFEPGGETALPLEVGPEQPTTPDGDQLADETSPQETEPVEDPDAHLLLPDQPEQEAPPEPTPGPAPSEVAPPAPVAPAPPEPAPVVAPSPPAETGDPAAEQPDPGKPREATPTPDPAPHDSPGERTPSTPGAEPARSRIEPPRQAPAAPAAPTVGVSQPSAPTAAPTMPTAPQPVVVAGASGPAASNDRSAAKNARFHVVKRGESLWSIARKLLGPSASPAQIAGEVNRLWELNRDRIGTGNRDLLMVGTEIRLR